MPCAACASPSPPLHVYSLPLPTYLHLAVTCWSLDAAVRWVQLAEQCSLRELRLACIRRLALLLASPSLPRAPATSVGDPGADSSSEESSSSSDASGSSSESDTSEDSLLPRPGKRAKLMHSARIGDMQQALADAAKLQASRRALHAWPAQCMRACTRLPPATFLPHAFP